MKKNIIWGVVFFLLITVFCSALYYIVLVDKQTKNNEAILKAQEANAEVKVEEKSGNKKLPDDNNIKPENKDDIGKVMPQNADEIINIESKNDAQKVLEEADKIVETMDNIPF